jgi:hypothetical protein
MIIAKIETFPLRIPFKREIPSAAAAWGDKNLPAADSLLVKVTSDNRLAKGHVGWRLITANLPSSDEGLFLFPLMLAYARR